MTDDDELKCVCVCVQSVSQSVIPFIENIEFIELIVAFNCS